MRILEQDFDNKMQAHCDEMNRASQAMQATICSVRLLRDAFVDSFHTSHRLGPSMSRSLPRRFGPKRRLRVRRSGQNRLRGYVASTMFWP